MRSQTTSWPLSSNTKKRVARHGYLSTQEYPRNEQDVTQQSTLVVLEDDLPCIRLDSMIIGTIEMVLIEVRYILNNYHNVKWSLIAPNIGQESRGYVVGIWRGHTKSIITWNCIYFIAKVDGWLQKYGMIPPTWYIQSSPHTTIHWLELVTSNQPNTILYMHSTYNAILMQISEGDIHLAFVIVLSKDWHMCTPHI